MGHRSIIWNCSDDIFKDIVEKCSTYSEILSQFGILNRGNNHKTLKKRMDLLGIVFESKRYSVTATNKRIKPIEVYLTKNSKANPFYLKKRLIKEGLLVERCSECGLGETWNNKPISLQLDHSNGDPTDNRLHNLKLLCPNCHSQTDNYCGKALKINLKYCLKCKKPISFKGVHNLCKKCFNGLLGKDKIKFSIEKEELSRLMHIMPICDIAKKHKVSHTTVSRWVKKYNLSKVHSVGYWLSKKTIE